jgi:hypothetical protein
MNITYAARLTTLLGLTGNSPAAKVAALTDRKAALEQNIAALAVERADAERHAAEQAAAGSTIDGSALASVDAREKAMRVALGGVGDLLEQAIADERAAAIDNLLKKEVPARVSKLTADLDAFAAACFNLAQWSSALGIPHHSLCNFFEHRPAAVHPLAVERARAEALGLRAVDICGPDMPLGNTPRVAEMARSIAKSHAKAVGLSTNLLADAERHAAEIVDAQATADAAKAAQLAAVAADAAEFREKLTAALEAFPSTHRAEDIAADQKQYALAYSLLGIGREQFGAASAPVRNFLQYIKLVEHSVQAKGLSRLRTVPANQIEHVRLYLGLPSMTLATF